MPEIRADVIMKPELRRTQSLSFRLALREGGNRVAVSSR